MRSSSACLEGCCYSFHALDAKSQAPMVALLPVAAPWLTQATVGCLVACRCFSLRKTGQGSAILFSVCPGRKMSCLNSILSAGDPPSGESSGGGQSDNAKCSYGFSSMRGKRSFMEDFYEARFALVEDHTVGLFGVFDGHGGSRAADYVQKNLFENLIKHPKFITDTKCAIVETYQQTDSEYLKHENSQHRDAGSTASTAVLVGDRLLVANVGDSRAVICRAGKAIALSTDHKPNRKDERQRIEKAGGVVMWAGTWRVGGVLAVSRAFGDRLLKQYVVAEPELQAGLATSSISSDVVYQNASAIFGTQEDSLRNWAHEMVSGICRGFSVPWV
ncbi:hypothetical protein L7F22_016422 [Adiantum nelumboides]|nr:hypothetical protein [Adiantum nelumboides]